MQVAQTILNSLQIASPCSADWASMSGSERIRFCAQCDKHVYDLSSLSASEALMLIREKEGRLCVRLWRRADGTVLTADCPVGRRRLRERRTQRQSAAAMAVLAAAMLSLACQRPKAEPEAKLTPVKARLIQPVPPTQFGIEGGIPMATVVVVGANPGVDSGVLMGAMVMDCAAIFDMGGPLPGPTQGRSYGRFEMDHLPLL